MAAAGLTSGAFYTHFRSKNALLEAIVDNELRRSIALFSNKSAAQCMAVIDVYLSQAHVAHIQSMVKDDAKAWSIIAQLVGAVVVAWGMPSEPARSALLAGVSQQVKQMLEDASQKDL